MQIAEESERALQEHQAAAAEREAAKAERRAAAHARNEERIERNLVKNDDDGFLHLLSCSLSPQKKEKILNWLSPGNFTARHSIITKTHVESTGTWLLDELRPWF